MGSGTRSPDTEEEGLWEGGGNPPKHGGGAYTHGHKYPKRARRDTGVQTDTDTKTGTEREGCDGVRKDRRDRRKEKQKTRHTERAWDRKKGSQTKKHAQRFSETESQTET